VGRITPTFRQLFEESIADLKAELQAAMISLDNKNAFDLLLKEVWSPEQAAMANSSLATVLDKMNIMAAIHNRKLISSLKEELRKKDKKIDELDSRISELELIAKELKTGTRKTEDEGGAAAEKNQDEK
jgi:hypothetical protein